MGALFLSGALRALAGFFSGAATGAASGTGTAATDLGLRDIFWLAAKGTVALAFLPEGVLAMVEG
jgi:hypothetical protein